MIRKFLYIIFALPLLASAQASVDWNELVHDFGAIDERDGNVTCDFRVTNSGDVPVAIVSARASCGCTTPQFSTSLILPGETSAVEVTFDPVGRPGRFDKKVKIDISAGDDAQNISTTLRIKGVVVGDGATITQRYPQGEGPMRLRSTVAAFGSVKNTRHGSAMIEAYNNSKDTIWPHWDGLPEYITVRLNGALFIAPAEQRTIMLSFDGQNAPDYGLVSSTFTLYPDRGDANPIAIDAVAMVQEDFSMLTPTAKAKAPVVATESGTIDFGTISRDGGLVSHSLPIYNRGDNPLLIRRAYSNDPGVASVTVTPEKVKKGKSATLTVTVDPSQLPSELLNARISVITNDYQTPNLILRAVGDVK